MSEQQPTDDLLLEEIVALVEAVLRDDATVAEKQRLSDLITHNSNARRHYVEAICDELNLSAAVADETFQNQEESEQEDKKEPLAIRSPILGFLSESASAIGEVIFRPTSLSLSIAFLVVASVLATLSLVYVGQDDQMVSHPTDEGRPPVVVGRVTALQNCTWSAGSISWRRDQPLYEGDLISVTAGVVQITLESQTTVLLQAPVNFRVDGKNSGTLNSGTLSAYVPKPAIGFKLETPTARIVDLGTEFGAWVDKNETTLVRVFQGKVEVEPKAADKPAAEKKRILKEGEALRVESSGKVTDPPPTEKKTFARRLLSPQTYREVVLADRPLLYWSFDEKSGAAIEQSTRKTHQQLKPHGGAHRVTHESLGSGLNLESAADLTGKADCFFADLRSPAISGAWAMEMWLQAKQSGPGYNSSYVIHTNPSTNSSSNPALLFDFDSSEDNALELFSRFNPTKISYKRTAGGPVLKEGRWHHLLFVYYGDDDGRGVANRLDIYQDGVRLKNVVRNGFGADLKINRLLVGTSRMDEKGFCGRLDELAFYDLGSMSEETISLKMAAMARRHVRFARKKIEKKKDK